MKNNLFNQYITRLSNTITPDISLNIDLLCNALEVTWNSGNTIYICGNGGSAANAIHIANDFIYGAGKNTGRGLRVEALSSNNAVLTCLANDNGYENIFSEQLKVKANTNDVLIALSGSGNSPNIIRAIEVANDHKMVTFAILGFDGGKCKQLVQHPLHFKIDDMQIAEDLQMIVGHICMQWLSKQKLS